MPARRLSISNRSEDVGHAAEINMTSREPVVMSGIVDAILEVGRQRNGLLGQLRGALQSGQNEQALAIARQLCGIPNHEEASYRTNTRIH